MGVSLHPRYVRMCANILPQNGPILGVQMDTGSGVRILEVGRNAWG